MHEMEQTRSRLDAFIERLGHGAVNIISRETGISRQHLYRFRQGKAVSWRTLEAIDEFLDHLAPAANAGSDRFPLSPGRSPRISPPAASEADELLSVASEILMTAARLAATSSLAPAERAAAVEDSIQQVKRLLDSMSESLRAAAEK